MAKWDLIRCNGSEYQFIPGVIEEDLARMIMRKDISWADFALVNGTLQRIYAIPTLMHLMPIAPDTLTVEKLRGRKAPPPAQAAAAAPGAAPKAPVVPAPVDPFQAAAAKSRSLWFLQFEGTEFGPISINELQTVVQTGKMRGALYAWTKGMENWTPVNSLSELSHLFSGAPEGLPARPPARFNPKIPDHEARASTRCRLVATVWQIGARHERIIVGICADISVTGMQVVIDNTQLAIAKGSELHLEIVPAGISGLESLKVKATVMWAKPEEHRIGLRFNALTPKDTQMLETYIAKASSGG